MQPDGKVDPIPEYEYEKLYDLMLKSTSKVIRIIEIGQRDFIGNETYVCFLSMKPIKFALLSSELKEKLHFMNFVVVFIFALSVFVESEIIHLFGSNNSGFLWNIQTIQEFTDILVFDGGR